MNWKTIAAASVGAVIGIIVVFGGDMFQTVPEASVSIEEADATPINVV